MNNLITIFMNYKVNRLVEYGVLAVKEDTPFIRQIFHGYFSTYVDNYYYSVFHTVEEERYNDKNLKLELKGIMEEMLDDYRAYELQVSNAEYALGRQRIGELHDISYDLIKLDSLTFENKEEISVKVYDFIASNKKIKELFEGRENQITRLIRETYQTCIKLLSYEDNYYHIENRKFIKKDKLVFLELIPSIKVLDIYRKSMVQKIYDDERLSLTKLECMIQKVSLEILKKTLLREKIPTYFMDFCDDAIARGKIQNSILALMDNPLFRKYVVLGVHYNTYLNQKTAFSEDYQFSCIQDFTHINDIYQKVDSIVKEGIFQYLIVQDCRFQDRDYFLTYENDSLEVLMFEEE